ncbi:MAG: aminoglycoside phosphotransferase family protein [Chloroflexi bacterium]|nr:aminoglycoside phosphotransferase family protein [Chloroflexota bacterium]
MTAPETRWRRGAAFARFSRAELRALLQADVLDAEPLIGGLRNSNYRVVLAGEPGRAVVRFYTNDDPLSCSREHAILKLIEGRVPAPRVLRSSPCADPPWSLLTWLDGVRYDEAHAHSPEALAQSAGKTLARIHAFEFEEAGFFGRNLEITEPLTVEHGWAEWITGWLVRGRAGQRLGADLARRILRFVDEHAAEMRQPHQPKPVLVHADYKPWNLLVDASSRICGVLDWEFSHAGSKLLDIGIFLRQRHSLAPAYEAAFEDGYRHAGGSLPLDWSRLSRLTDLICLVQLVDRDETEDPRRTADLCPLIEATLAL